MRAPPSYKLVCAAIAAFWLLGGLAASPSQASQPYGLTESASIALSGQPAASLDGTLRLAFSGLCVLPPGAPTLCDPLAYAVQELDLAGGGFELSLQPLPPIPPVGFLFGSDITLQTGVVSLRPLILEREILAEGERAPGEAFVDFREWRLSPRLDPGGSGYGQLDYDAPADLLPSALRLHYALEEYAATIISDPNGADDGVLFLPFVEPDSETTTTLAAVTLDAVAIPDPPPPLPAVGEFLGLGPAVGESHATAVADDGRSVSGYASSGISTHGFRWTQATGARTPLGNLRGLGTSRGFSISPDGTRVAGTFDAAQYSTPSREAARWNDLLELERLEGPPVFAQSVGEDITSSGEVAGWHQIQSPYRIQAQRWDAAGTRTPLPDLSADRPFGRAHALSEDGSIVVGVSARSDAVPNTAVRWANGDVQDLGSLAPGALSWAWDVSADGDTAVGWSGIENLQREAFRWTAANGMKGLGDLPGGEHRSEAFGVSAGGELVVGSGFGASGEEAFVWDRRRGMRRLQEVLEHALGSAPLAGWQLTRATGITPDGRVIVGDGVDPGGYTEAWRAVLPEVATDVEIDLLPDRARGRGARHRIIRVAVLGSDQADVDDIDLETLRFGPGGAAPVHDLTGRRSRRSHQRDVNRDGRRDLVLHFRRSEIRLAPDATQACLAGEIEGAPFDACDGLLDDRSLRRGARQMGWLARFRALRH